MKVSSLDLHIAWHFFCKSRVPTYVDLDSLTMESMTISPALSSTYHIYHTHIRPMLQRANYDHYMCVCVCVEYEGVNKTLCETLMKQISRLRV